MKTQPQHTVESKRKISIGRSKFLKENPELHPWKLNSKFKSEPCENLKRELSLNKIIFISEWKPLENRAFSIDIAFPDIKVGIEVNGNQHYDREGNLRPYYQNRHDLITEAGWKLIQLHYVSCFDKKYIDQIINDIGQISQPDYSKYFEQKKKNIKKPPPRGFSHKIAGDKKWAPYLKLVQESGIDLTKFGWVQKVSKLLDITPQNVNRWMKRHLPELYKTCFKKKTKF